MEITRIEIEVEFVIAVIGGVHITVYNGFVAGRVDNGKCVEVETRFIKRYLLAVDPEHAVEHGQVELDSVEAEVAFYQWFGEVAADGHLPLQIARGIGDSAVCNALHGGQLEFFYTGFHIECRTDIGMRVVAAFYL